jgi:hypothetical protein
MLLWAKPNNLAGLGPKCNLTKGLNYRIGIVKRGSVTKEADQTMAFDALFRIARSEDRRRRATTAILKPIRAKRKDSQCQGVLNKHFLGPRSCVRVNGPRANAISRRGAKLSSRA